MEKEIYSGIYGGIKKTDVRDLVTVTCEKYEKCSLYKAGRCACLPALFKSDCPFGKRSRTRGYSERASKYYDWRKKIAERDSYHKVSDINKYIAKVGDDLMSDMYCGIYWNKDESRWCGPKLSSTVTVLPISEINPDTLYSLYKYIPKTVFGSQPVKGWEKDRTDWFTKLNETFPELILVFKNKYPDIDLTFSHIGRHAYVKTLVDGTIIQDDSKLKWVFDKKNMTIKNDTFRPEYRSIFGDRNVTARIESPVTDRMVCKVLDDNWVDENTIYVE